jgi:hypothetical protein
LILKRIEIKVKHYFKYYSGKENNPPQIQNCHSTAEANAGNFLRGMGGMKKGNVILSSAATKNPKEDHAPF